MLVLSRKIDEAIEIGPNIRLIVVEIRGDKVRLGFDAPKGVEIWREEVAQAIRRDGKRRAVGDKTEEEGLTAEDAEDVKDEDTQDEENGS